MHLEVRHLKLIAAVAEEKSVTRAATRLHLTQSALSHQLRDIEDKLGTGLFLRLSKKMILTQAGERLLNSAQVVLSELQQVEEDIKQIAQHRESVLRLSTECYTCYHWLPTVLKNFNESFPRVEVRIVVEATRQPIPWLLDGKLDLAIVCCTARNQKLLFKPLFRDELVVIVAPDHPLASRPYLVAQDFADEHVLTYTMPRTESTLLQQVLLPAGVVPKQISQVQLTEAIVEMVKAGLGISAVARWAVAPQLAAGTLHAVPLTKKGFHRQWSAALVKTKTVPPYLQKFVDLLAQNPLVAERKPARRKMAAIA